MACSEREPGRVVADDYRQFWLWAGVDAPDWLEKADEVYVLDGELRTLSRNHYVPLRLSAPAVAGPRIWLVVRTDTLDWPKGMAQLLHDRIESWRRAGSNVAGLQVDFDAHTRGLTDYAVFLERLRQDLPADDRLSITGLMDWSANGDPRALANLGKTIDEVVIQTYQGRSTILGYERYFDRMKGFPLPFKVGLVEGGQWFPPPGLENERNFRGYVVFLQPSSQRRSR